MSYDPRNNMSLFRCSLWNNPAVIRCSFGMMHTGVQAGLERGLQRSLEQSVHTGLQTGLQQVYKRVYDRSTNRSTTGLQTGLRQVYKQVYDRSTNKCSNKLEVYRQCALVTITCAVCIRNHERFSQTNKELSCENGFSEEA